jgi:hypothetical protein
MAEPTANKGQESSEPRWFGEHTRRRSGENAHEQGWGLNEDERRKIPEQKQNYEGGIDYDYGARDFGDTAVDTRAANPSGNTPASEKKGSEEVGRRRGANQRTSARRG